MMRPIFGAIAAALVALASSAHGQAHTSDALVLARVCVHEAGWEDAGDCEAIHAVLAGGAARHGLNFRAYAFAYSGRALRGLTSRPWAAQLDESGGAPSAWPRVSTVRRGGVAVVVEHAPWSAYRDRWLAALERAQSIVAGERTHGCEREPHDWGGAVDMERARRLGLIEVDCSRGDVATRNRFYLRPSLLRGEEG